MNIKTNLVNQDSELMIQPVSEDQSDFIEICIARQNQKHKQLIANKAAIEKQNEQAKFYLTMFKFGIAFGLLIIILCIAVNEQAKIKTQQQQETEALLKQLEKGEVISMTARVGGAE
ncbi:MAG: hypothetical protein RSA84_10445 [Acinetobacter sp.]